MNQKFEDLMNTVKIHDFCCKKQQEEEEKSHAVVWVLAIIGAVAVIAGIAYAVYRYLTPNYIDMIDEDFDDDLDFYDDDFDDYDDDDFDDESDEDETE